MFQLRLTLLTVLCVPVLSSAQYFEQEVLEEIQVQERGRPLFFNSGIGLDNDHYRSMSLTDIMAFASEPEAMQRNLSLFEEESTTVTRGVGLYANIGFAPKTTGGAYSETREIQVGVSIHSKKEAMVTFKNKDLDTSIVYCNLQGEFAVEGAYLFKGKWGKRFHWYVGAGLNGGMSFGNEMILISGRYFEPGQHPSVQESTEMNKELFRGKQVYYSRIYIPYGFQFGMGPRWQLGTDWRLGVGMQFIEGEAPNFIERTGLGMIGAKYRF